MRFMDAFRKYWAELSLLAIIVVGLSLRLYHLNYQGYFSEELFTTDAIRMPYWGLILDPFINPQTGEPPLYFLAAKISANLLGGISLLSIRLPAAVLGALCIPAIFALGREYCNELTGLFAALTIALSERMVFYSQYGRPYTMVFLFFVFATYCFVRIQKKDPFARWMILFILATGLCLWTHYYSAVPLSVFWAILVWQNKKSIVPYLAMGVIPALAFGLYIRGVIWEYLTYPLSVIYPASVFNITWIDNLFRVPYECWGYLAIPLILVFLYYIRSRGDRIAQWFGLSAGITFLSMLVLTAIFDPSARYAVLIAPLIIVPAMAIVTEFVSYGKEPFHRFALSAGAVYVIITANLFPLIALYTTTYHFVFL
jgi:uncharacterized membrane protein